VAKADCLGRTGSFSTEAMEWFIAEVKKLAVERKAPPPLLLGRDILGLGIEPGPRVGRILTEVYEQQLDSKVQSHDEALAAARRIIELA
jgi:tRNA nucleotidyltransferase (CCA-adding enzyme)